MITDKVFKHYTKCKVCNIKYGFDHNPEVEDGFCPYHEPNVVWGGRLKKFRGANNEQ